MKSKIIVIEGIDGTGKTTLIKALKTILRKKHLNIMSIANPNIRYHKSLSRYAHYFMQENGTHEIAKAMIYGALVLENQKEYFGKKYDYILVDRFLHSTFAYNIFYPALQATLPYDESIVADNMMELFYQYSLAMPCLPHIYIILRAKEPINDKYLPMDYHMMNMAYHKAEKVMQCLYDRAGQKYKQIVLNPAYGIEHTLNSALNIISKLQLEDEQLEY